MRREVILGILCGVAVVILGNCADVGSSGYSRPYDLSVQAPDTSGARAQVEIADLARRLREQQEKIENHEKRIAYLELAELSR
jgi:hypothetical protein